MSNELWIPRTKLGELVREGKVTSLSEIFAQGHKIQEPQIVDILLPNLQQEVLCINLVQKQTDAGEKSQFQAVVAIGNRDGYIGLGYSKARQVRTAIERATGIAKMHIIPIKRGCGSWQCCCKELHSLPFKVYGHCGGVRIEIFPAPRGVGVVAGGIAKVILELAGVKDCWTKSRGSTRTSFSLAYATFDALKNTCKVMTKEDWE